MLACAEEPDTYQSLARRGTVAGPRRTLPRSSIAIPIDDSWWPFGRSHLNKSPSTSRAASNAGAASPAAGPNTTAPLSPSNTNKERAAALQRELDAYLRRMQVCDRLKEIADETGDSALEQQAELMAQRAWFVYQQRTAQLKLPGLVPLDEQAATDSLLSQQERRERSQEPAPLRSVRAERSANSPGGKP